MQIPEEIVQEAQVKNQWFVPEFIHLAAKNWAQALTAEKCNQWVDLIKPNAHPIEVGIIMAGNIPLVGLHDLICAFACQCKSRIK